MDRDKAERLVEQYVDGALAPVQAREFERCMADDESLREAVEDARLIRSELPKLVEDAPDEGYWRRLAGKLVLRERRPPVRWKTRLAFGGAVACIAFLVGVSLSYRAELRRLREAAALPADGTTAASLTKYFEPSERTSRDRAVFDSLEATYPERMEWVGRSNGHAFLGLSDTPAPAAGAGRTLLAIETVVLRTTAGGKREVVLRPRVVALDGAETAIEVPATTGRPEAVIRTALNVRDGRVGGSVEFACAAEPSGTALASTGAVSLALGEPARVLSLNLGEAEYALLLRSSVLGRR